MSITINATYEDGVLKLDSPLPLSEHEKVRVTVEPQLAPPNDAEPNPAGALQQPIWEQIAALTANLPKEVIELLPTDGASQHDHYIYGTPKRTDLPE